jgi:RyR domain
MSTYRPSPIDTSTVQLTADHAELISQLTKNAHEIWAQKRIADGWSYGPSRDDTLKTHPCLVPFEVLPDSEKEYDRAMVDAVVRAAVSLGFRIEKR